MSANPAAAATAVKRIDHDQQGHDKKRNEDRDSGLDHLLEHGEGEDSDLLQRRHERARVLGDVEGVRLEQEPALDVDREIVAETEDEVLARPGELQPNRAGHQCEDDEKAGCRNEALTVARCADRVEGGGDQRQMLKAVRIGE